MNTPIRFALIAGVLASGLAAGLLIAGPLNPPGGSIASTYKTLTEVEPRIAINATNTPGDSDSLYRITQPGSYYLTGNITGVSGKRGIEIASNDVTIDLHGFALLGVPGAMQGISTTLADAVGISIMNGTVRGWPMDGIAVHIGGVFGGRIDGIIAENNAGNGIRVGNQFSVTRCASIDNGDAGFVSATTCTFISCSSRGNASHGFLVTAGCAISDCAAYLNDGDGFNATFDGTTFNNCTASANIGDGFEIDYGGAIVNCVASTNQADGFLVASRNLLIGNTANDNGLSLDGGSGIRITGSDNRVEGNNCTAATFGIRVSAAGNFITRNVCSGNTTNWDISAGNTCLVVNAATNASAWSGNSGGAAPGSTDPNANFTY
ncbi:MAG: hypothetical protein IT432_16695 [Phycisphaerales bacterium]|nr:hypothetical protein [Phycisphaerales bacterium]